MTESLYKHLAKTWQKPDKSFQSPNWNRLIEWRKGDAFTRVEKPLRLDRARRIGYKAKQGYVVVRARVRRGGLNKSRFDGGRVPSKMGVNKITMRQNIQAIAEVRTAKRYPNLEVLNSYWVGEDGQHKYYEVILVDPHHPVIQNDPKINWICAPGNTNRVLRGKTASGQRHRGLMKTGKGSEHTRPSVRKSHRRDKDTKNVPWFKRAPHQ
ncbi:MAG: 50S ribosomal protein L15e [Euryarchaeota archaeon]|nr:50S ribosomal protein L15e [Euryarchaeota archaeon]